MDENLKKNITEQTVWIRGLFMLAFYIIFHVVEFVVACIAVIQWVLVLLTRKPNENLDELGKSLGLYLAQIIYFLTFHSDARPYPFAPWPK